MKIGDRIFVRGYIDEIRKDTVIVRNDGGYFGTILSEVTGELPSVQPEPCEDAVSRHRLLNDLEELTTAWEKYPVMAEQIKGVEVAIGYVKSIPSVQPETHEERTETHACDLISRAMLLEYIHNEPVGKMLCDKYNLDGVIKQLPSAQPERLMGLWTDNNACPFCGFQPWYERDIHTLSYCPNCGADLRGEK